MTTLEKFMRFLAEKNYYISDEMVDQYWELRQEDRETHKKDIADAMLYALDEDGHTGDWKIRFINEYYESNFRV